MNSEKSTAAAEPHLEPAVVLPFVRNEAGRITTIALVSFRSEYRNDAPLKSLRAAVTEWVRTTEAGARCWDLSSADLNVGDLINEDAFANPDFIKCLAKQALHEVRLLAVVDHVAGVNYDTVLANGPTEDELLGAEPEIEQAAFQTYTLYTGEDGSITGTAFTNDNNDWGTPNESASWEVRYRDRTDMEKQTGKTHVGLSGVRVEVTLDGVRV